MDKECCLTCKKRFDIKKLDYSHGGCEHSDIEGFICMAFADEGIASWMVGIENGMCECYTPKDSIS